MTYKRTTLQSPYTVFAKLYSEARFNLATSGVKSLALSELPPLPSTLEINGPNAYGYEPLVERLAAHSNTRPGCVVTAAGTSFANHLAMAALFEPGDEVLIEEPTYESILVTAQFLGASVRRFRRDPIDFSIDPEEVRRAITPRTRLIALCNLHNPSSAFTGNEILREVGEIALEHGARVLVDEVYLECIWEQRPESSFRLGDHFVVTTSLTKAYGLSGLRCGWILAEPALAQRMRELNDVFGSTGVFAGEALSVFALEHLEQLTARGRHIVETNRKAMHEFLRSRNDLECVLPQFGTTVFPKLLTGSADEFFEFFRERYEGSFVPGRFFECPQHMRLGLGGAPEMTKQSIERLASALDAFARR